MALTGILHLALPYPPSVNTYWRSIVMQGRPRVLLSKAAREYRQAVQLATLGAKPLLGRLSVSIELSPPDKRQRDLDNCGKGLLDALQHAGVYRDDSQIDDLRIIRRPPVKGGACAVSIHELHPTTSKGET